MEALCLPCSEGLQHYQQFPLCGKPGISDHDEVVMASAASSAHPDVSSAFVQDSKLEAQQQEQLNLIHTEHATPERDECRGLTVYSAINTSQATHDLREAQQAASSPISAPVDAPMGPAAVTAHDRSSAEPAPTPAISEEQPKTSQPGPQVSTPAVTAVAGGDTSTSAPALVISTEDVAEAEASPVTGTSDMALAGAIEDDVAAALGLVLLHVQPPGTAAASDEENHSIPSAATPSSTDQDRQRPMQQHDLDVNHHAGCNSSATSASGFKGPARQQGFVHRKGFAGLAASPNKQRVASARLRAAKRQGHRLDHPGVSGVLPATVAASRKVQQPLRVPLQAAAAALVHREPSPAARAAAAAAHAAAATPASAAVLLAKVQAALQQQRGRSSVQGTAAAAAAICDPASLLAAAAAPWYPPGGKGSGFLVLRRDKLVTRKLYTLPSAAADAAADGDRQQQVGSKRKACALLQVLHQQIQQEHAATDYSVADIDLDVSVPARRTALAATEPVIKKLTDVEMEHKLKLQQQRQQQLATGRSQSASPPAAPGAPWQSVASYGDLHEGATALVQAAAAAVAAHTAEAAAEADRRHNPRRKRKMPSKLDDTLSTDCALQIISGRGWVKSSLSAVQQQDTGGRNAAARAGSGSPETAAPAMTRIKRLLLLEQQQQQQPENDLVHVLKEQLNSAAAAIKSAGAAGCTTASSGPPVGEGKQQSSAGRPARMGNPKQQQAKWLQHVWWVDQPMSQRDMQKQWWQWAEREQQKVEKQEMEDLLSRYVGGQQNPASQAKAEQPQQHPEGSISECDEQDEQEKQDQQKPQLQLKSADVGPAVWSCLARQPAAASAAAEAAVQSGTAPALKQLSSLAAAVNRAATAGDAASATTKVNAALASFLMPSKQLTDLLQQHISKPCGAVASSTRPLTRHAAAAAVKVSGGVPDAKNSFSVAEQGPADGIPLAAAGPTRRAARKARREEAALAAAAEVGKRPAADITEVQEVLTAGPAAAEDGQAGSQPSADSDADDAGRDSRATKKARVRHHLNSIFGKPDSKEVELQPVRSVTGVSSTSAVAAGGGRYSARISAQAAAGANGSTAFDYQSGYKLHRKGRRRGPAPMLKNQQQLEQMMLQQHNQQRLEIIYQRQQMQAAAEQRQQQAQQARVQALIQRIAAQQLERQLDRDATPDDDDDLVDSPTETSQQPMQPGLFAVVLGQSQGQQQRQQQQPQQQQPQLQVKQPTGDALLKLNTAINRPGCLGSGASPSAPLPSILRQQQPQNARAVMAAASQEGNQGLQQQMPVLLPAAQRPDNPQLTISPGLGGSSSSNPGHSNAQRPDNPQLTVSPGLGGSSSSSPGYDTAQRPANPQLTVSPGLGGSSSINPGHNTAQRPDNPQLTVTPGLGGSSSSNPGHSNAQRPDNPQLTVSPGLGGSSSINPGHNTAQRPDNPQLTVTPERGSSSSEIGRKKSKAVSAQKRSTLPKLVRLALENLDSKAAAAAQKRPAFRRYLMLQQQQKKEAHERVGVSDSKLQQTQGKRLPQYLQLPLKSPAQAKPVSRPQAKPAVASAPLPQRPRYNVPAVSSSSAAAVQAAAATAALMAPPAPALLTVLPPPPPPPPPALMAPVASAAPLAALPRPPPPAAAALFAPPAAAAPLPVLPRPPPAAAPPPPPPPPLAVLPPAPAPVATAAPVASTGSAAVAASRARLLAALGGDDDAPPPRMSTTGPCAVPRPAAGLHPPGSSFFNATSGQLPTRLTPLQPCPTAGVGAPAAVQAGGRGLMYLPIMPMTFMPSPALLHRLPPHVQPHQQSGGGSGNMQ